MADFDSDVWSEQNRNAQRRVVQDWSPDAGVRASYLTFRSLGPGMDAMLAVAMGQSLQAPPAGQLTGPTGHWFTVGVSLVDGPDLIH